MSEQLKASEAQCEQEPGGLEGAIVALIRAAVVVLLQ